MRTMLPVGATFEEAMNTIAIAQESYEGRKFEEAANEIDDAIELLTKILRHFEEAMDEEND